MRDLGCQSRRAGDRALDHQPRHGPRRDHHRRRRRDRSRIELPARRGLPRGAGLPVQPRAAQRRDRGAAEGAKRLGIRRARRHRRGRRAGGVRGRHSVIWMERSEIRVHARATTAPDCASLHPGYEFLLELSRFRK